MVDGSKVRGIQNYATELSSATGSESRNDARITVSKNTRYWHPLRNGRSQGWKTHNRSSDKGAMSVPAFKETLIKFDAAVLNGRPLEKSSKLPQQADKVEEMLNAMIPPRYLTALQYRLQDSKTFTNEHASYVVFFLIVAFTERLLTAPAPGFSMRARSQRPEQTFPT